MCEKAYYFIIFVLPMEFRFCINLVSFTARCHKTIYVVCPLCALASFITSSLYLSEKTVVIIVIIVLVLSVHRTRSKTYWKHFITSKTVISRKQVDSFSK